MVLVEEVGEFFIGLFLRKMKRNESAAACQLLVDGIEPLYR